ncbi:GIN domain-containing protein [Undibacterium sp.]|uniref:GIN domain-containing protein n=1 Tax=Undibacterium sp. TaxID=1914977 RepID=UPI002CCC66C6|nr:DUF2807 domain-containing protein [Undibacterium sp.]HTD06304.1 DUF2807 domain-containing protein [Undibacterium sp.]
MRRLFVLPAFFLLSAFAHADEQSRTTPAFNAINSKGPISIVVEVGKTQSVVVSGNDKFIREVVTEVVGNELLISIPGKKSSTATDDPRVIITLPALRQLKIEGAGATAINNISGDRIDISYQGAGSLKANGKVKWLRLKAQGVGAVDTKELHAEHVDVDFEGIGTVKVYATDLLNAVVQGMGSLTYYGNPRTFNKSVQGIGSVSAGK